MLASRVGDDAFRIGKNSRGNPCPFEVMLYQPRDVWIVLNDEYSALHNVILAAALALTDPKRPVLWLILCKYCVNIAALMQVQSAI